MVIKNFTKGANKYLSRRKWHYTCLIATCIISLIFTVPQFVAQPPQRFVTVTFDDLPVITDCDGSVDFSALAHTCDRVTQIPISN